MIGRLPNTLLRVPPMASSFASNSSYVHVSFVMESDPVRSGTKIGPLQVPGSWGQLLLGG